jgi:hypothetical protein
MMMSFIVLAENHLMMMMSFIVLAETKNRNRTPYIP